MRCKILIAQICAILAASLSAWAEEPKLALAQAGLEERWAPVGTVDYLSIGALGAGTLGGVLVGRDSPGFWTQGILFDDSIRDSLRLRSLGGRQAAGDVSDFGRNFLMATPLLLDSVGLSLWRDHDSTGAWRIAVIDLQAFAVAGFLTQVTKVIVGRARPYQPQCASDPSYAGGCGSGDAFQSFFSGHSSMAFTGASLLCLNHDGRGLFGNAWADGATCVGAMSLAATTGVLRIATDAHYATDVLTGALVGLFSGLYIPTHFHRPENTAQSKIEQSTMVLPVGSDGLLVTQSVRF